MAEDYRYFILTRAVFDYSVFQPGQICFLSTKKYEADSSCVEVRFIGSYSSLDYPVELERLQPLSREEAALLLALRQEDRFVALQQGGLSAAQRLEVGSEVFVNTETSLLKGTIRYIGNITEPLTHTDLQGVFFGVELQDSDKGKGNSDGWGRYERFFTCERNCGIFTTFDRIISAESLTGPGPGPGPEPSSMSRPQPRHDPNQSMDQPMSFQLNHFHVPQKSESRPEPCSDSAPRPLRSDSEPMEGDHIYEDPDLHRELAEGSKNTRSKSLKLPLSISNRNKTKANDAPKNSLKERPGSARRAPATETRPETGPETKGAGLAKSIPKPDKFRLAAPRSRPGLRSGLRSQSESEPRTAPDSPEKPEPSLGVGSTDGLQKGDKGRSQISQQQLVFQRGSDSSDVPLREIMKLGPEEEGMDVDDKGAPGVQLKESRPETRAGSEAKSWADVARTLGESENKVKQWNEPETGAQTRLDPPKDLKPESGEKVTAGDHVWFLNEKNQKCRGTVVFLEKDEDKTHFYVTDDSEALHGPLFSVTKIGPKTTDPEDSNMDQDFVSSLGVDSLVEIDLKEGVKAFGIIRWIGTPYGVPHQMAGLELEKPLGFCDGVFQSQRFFTCPGKHAMFVRLSSCRPDSRFRGDTADHTRPTTRPHHNGFPLHQTEVIGDVEPVPPIAAEDVERVLVGRMRGIQGHHNSCYMDSALFSLFSVSPVLDSLLFKSTSNGDKEVQRILLRDIVNPLRREGFVHGHHVMNLRKLLQKHGFSNSFTTDEKDPEEFLTVMMQHILNLDPLLKLCSGGEVQDAFCFQIFLDKNQNLLLPSVQQLLEHAFHSNNLKLSEMPSCLILQMPRFGKKFKMFDRILPSLELDVTDLLQHSQKQCVLCGDMAQFECHQCFLDPAFSSNGLKLLCRPCSKQVHVHPRRRGHAPNALELCHRGPIRCFQGNRDKLHLLAVLCIETSHYVSFVKYGSGPQDWLFFDSMADREGEADGFNVPQVTLAPEIDQYLNMPLTELANQVPRDMKGVAKRLLCDAYLYVYHRPSLYT